MSTNSIRICTVRKPRNNFSRSNFPNTNGMPLQSNDISVSNGTENPFELLLPTSTLWQNGTELKIAFMGGTKLIRDKIKEFASEWLKYANLNFTYITKPEQAEIRISFKKRSGSWSAVGTDNLDYGTNEATMNFGWLDKALPEEDFRSVVLHEFGHMIGCGHEHESPKNGGVPWDKRKAYDYYMRTQGWSKQDVDEQIFDTYKHSQIRGSKLDRRSIMMYAIPESITIGNFKVGWNTRLSRNDKVFIKQIYPFD